MSQDVNITIGGSLNALQWAYQRGTRLIINEPSFPPPYEPPSTKLAWGLLYYKLVMDGKVIGGDYVNAIKINNEEIIVACKNNIINKITYDKITIFDDKNITGLPDVKEEVDSYIVTDTMHAKSFVFKDTDFQHHTGDNLASQINIHKDYVNSPAQIWVISHLSQKQLQSFDYSDTMAKFKTESILKELGFTGNFMKRDEIVLEVDSRKTQKRMNVYNETEKMTFVYDHD